MSSTKRIKRNLKKSIKSVCKRRAEFVVDPSRDFTRHGKLPLEACIKSVLSFTSKSYNGEMVDLFACKPDMPTVSALHQRLGKIKYSAFQEVFSSFTSACKKRELFNGYNLYIADGSDLRTLLNPDDKDSFFENGDKESFNLYHLNALYDLNNNVYIDADVQKRLKMNENSSLVKMIERNNYSAPTVLIADRNYESYNTMAHIQEKGQFFLFRAKDINSTGIVRSFDLPDNEEFDLPIEVNLTRRKTKDVLELLKDRNHYHLISPSSPFDFLPENSKKSDDLAFFSLRFRIVRFKISDDSYEVILTNLNQKQFPPSVLKELYAMRWGIEVSFRTLKYTIGLLHFHSKKPEYILQEIFARLTMYNFTAFIAAGVPPKKPKDNRKHKYKVNFSVATGICRKFFLGLCTPETVEAVIRRHILPIRPNKHKPRKNLKSKPAVCFLYRIA